jgi:hypothetical protein
VPASQSAPENNFLREYSVQREVWDSSVATSRACAEAIAGCFLGKHSRRWAKKEIGY